MGAGAPASKSNVKMARSCCSGRRMDCCCARSVSSRLMRSRDTTGCASIHSVVTHVPRPKHTSTVTA